MGRRWRGRARRRRSGSARHSRDDGLVDRRRARCMLLTPGARAPTWPVGAARASKARGHARTADDNAHVRGCGPANRRAPVLAPAVHAAASLRIAVGGANAAGGRTRPRSDKMAVRAGRPSLRKSPTLAVDRASRHLAVAFSCRDPTSPDNRDRRRRSVRRRPCERRFPRRPAGPSARDRGRRWHCTRAQEVRARAATT